MHSENEISREALDRLVDGELSERDYGKLLLSLEETPDGWRRCALTFLEQQALQRDLREMLEDRIPLESEWDSLADDPLVSPETTPDLGRADSGNWLSQPWVRWSAVLAVGILAFIGGIALRPFGKTGVPTEDGVVQHSPSMSSPNIQDVGEPSVSDSGLHTAALFIDGPGPVEVPVSMIANSNGPPKFAPENFPPQLASVLGKSTNPNRVERLVYFIRTDDGKTYILPFDRVIQDDFQ